MTESCSTPSAPIPAPQNSKHSLRQRGVRVGTGALLVGAAPALALLGASTASAATIAVSNTNDSGSGSLRDALAAASSGDTIDLSGLTGAIQPLTPLSVPTNVSIIGPGAGNLTIEGGYLAGGSVLSMFMLDGGNGLTTFSDITLSGVTVGSAINCTSHPGLDLAIDSVVITGNTNPTDQGGGIYVKNCGSVEITDSEFSDNTSLYGGAGAYIKATNSALDTVTITGSTFDNNTITTKSSNYYYSSGGGLWVSAYTVDITDSSFTNNYAYYQGAGAFLKAQTVTITRSDVSLNTSNTDGGGGTGVYMTSRGQTSSATVSNSSFQDNTGYMGGGIYATNFTSFTMSSSLISGNSTKYKGAGVLLRNDSNDIFNTTIADNEVGPMSAGAAYITGDTRMEFVTMASNTAFDSGGFGGLYLHGGTWTIDSSIIAENGTVNIKKYNTNATATQSVLGPFEAGAVSTDATDALGVTNAGLGSLSDNGGPTLTKPLLASSPAIDVVTTLPAPFPGSAFDQRGTGYDRVTGNYADAGAFEYGSVVPTSSTSTSSTTPSSTTTIDASTSTTVASESPTTDPTLAGGLPSTGSDTTPLVASGAALIILGGAGAAFAARRRQMFGSDTR